MRSVDPTEIVARACANLQVDLEACDAETVVEPLPLVMGDPCRLTLLFENLISNAIKYRQPDRRLRVEIGAARAHDVWHFRVSDNGIGIEEKFFKKIFVLGERLHNQSISGNGYGLSMCEKIVARLWLALREEPATSPWPDLDAAWNDARRVLARAHIQTARLPRYLILGALSAELQTLFDSFEALSATPQADAPFHVFARRDAVFIVCDNLSHLGMAPSRPLSTLTAVNERNDLAGRLHHLCTLLNNDRTIKGGARFKAGSRAW